MLLQGDFGRCQASAPNSLGTARERALLDTHHQALDRMRLENGFKRLDDAAG
jgi:hypothetical protein